MRFPIAKSLLDYGNVIGIELPPPGILAEPPKGFRFLALRRWLLRGPIDA
jgi:hypothetical protein